MTTTPGAMSISDVAELTGLSTYTLRYYERRRLLAPPVRRPSGQRTYPETAVDLLRCIKGAQRLGFTPAVTVLESIDLMLQKLPLDDLGWLANPRWYNIAWMSVLEEVHAAQRDFGSIY